MTASFRQAAGSIVLGFGLCASGFAAPDSAADSAIAEAATDAQTRCYRLVHDDTWAYRDCIVEMLRAEPKPTARRLGIAYFGWVGAMNSQRIGMAGAQETAEEFLPMFRAAQKRLRVDDARLCRSIPGDCVARTARMLQTEAGLSTPALRKALAP